MICEAPLQRFACFYLFASLEKYKNLREKVMSILLFIVVVACSISVAILISKSDLKLNPKADTNAAKLKGCAGQHMYK